MSDLAKNIELCNGEDECFGKSKQEYDDTRINPIVFRSGQETTQVMVITEQPKGDRITKDSIKDGLRSGHKNRVPQRLIQLLGDDFKDSVIDENGVYYWTHFIKCPGNFREDGFKLNVNACADKYLLQELSELRPSLLICVGGRASQWFLEKAGSKKDWRDCILEQLCTEKISTYAISLSNKNESFEIKTAFLFHPAERSGIGWHFDEKLTEVLRMTVGSIIQ